MVEVGPGPGGLTRALFLEGAERVVAVERDERCRPALEAIAERYPGRLAVHYGDALEADWRTLAAGSAAKPIIAANLPYNVATLLLIGWLESEPWPPWYGRMVLMFQKEVAERIVAAPGIKAYGRLAVIAQWRTQPRLLFTVKPEAFTPPPTVSSAIVEFTPIERPSPECSVKTLGAVTAAAFGQRRKMLRQSLKSLLPEPGAPARRRRHRPDAARRGADRARLCAAGLRVRAAGRPLPLRASGQSSVTALPARRARRRRGRSGARASTRSAARIDVSRATLASRSALTMT